MNVKTAYSIKGSVEEVVKDIKEQIGDFDAKAVLYFGSASFEPSALSAELKNVFGSAQLFGCSTAGEITTGKMLQNSVVAMAFNSNVIDDIKIEVLENLKGSDNVGDKVAKSFESFESYYGKSMMELDFQKYVGLILIDGLSNAEEKIMDKIGNLTNVNFIGASAGDDLKFTATYVYANGKAYTNAAVLALLKPSVGFDFIKTQSFCELGKKFVATKVNEEAREIIEFDNKPAVVSYAEAVGVSPDQASSHFMTHPVGLMADGEPYVRSPQRINNNSMHFYCNVPEGMTLSLLKSTDIIKDTKKAVQEKINEIGNVSAIIDFDCILRALELRQNGLCEQYGEIFANVPTIGFSTYGEEFIGHINQTATMLVFK